MRLLDTIHRQDRALVIWNEGTILPEQDCGNGGKAAKQDNQHNVKPNPFYQNFSTW